MALSANVPFLVCILFLENLLTLCQKNSAFVKYAGKMGTIYFGGYTLILLWVISMYAY